MFCIFSEISIQGIETSVISLPATPNKLIAGMDGGDTKSHGSINYFNLVKCYVKTGYQALPNHHLAHLCHLYRLQTNRTVLAMVNWYRIFVTEISGVGGLGGGWGWGALWIKIGRCAPRRDPHHRHPTPTPTPTPKSPGPPTHTHPKLTQNLLL